MALTDADLQFHAAVDAAVTRCKAKPMPFLVPDPDDPQLVLSMWSVTETGDFQADEIMGLAYAEDLIQRAKELSRQYENPVVGRVVIEAVLHEIVRKGKVGPIEQGFLARFVMAVIAASFN